MENAKKRAYKEAAESPEHVKHDVFYAVSPETTLNTIVQSKDALKNNVWLHFYDVSTMQRKHRKTRSFEGHKLSDKTPWI